MLLLLSLACAPPAAPDPCAVARLPAPGPLSSEIAAAPDMVARAEIRIREAQRTGDGGFLALALPALTCALQQDPDAADDPRWRLARADLHLQSHEFRAALDLLARPGEPPGWQAWMLRCDAAMELGDLDAAERACQRAVDLRPGPLTYERAAHLRWLWGDLPGALDLAREATRSPADPEATAWLLAQRARLELQAAPPPATVDALIARALAAVPGYPPALMLRGRIALHAGRAAEADADFAAVGATVEARRGRWEVARYLGDPAAIQAAAEAVSAARRQDRRGYAAWLLARSVPLPPAEADRAEAAALLTAELGDRQDALTRLLALSAAPGRDPAAIRAALATGTLDPRALLIGGAALGDAEVLRLALASGPLLWPSEHERAALTPGLPATVP